MSTVFNLIDIITFKFCSSPFFVFCTYVYVYACIYYMHKSRCVCVWWWEGGREGVVFWSIDCYLILYSRQSLLLFLPGLGVFREFLVSISNLVWVLGWWTHALLCLSSQGLWTFGLRTSWLCFEHFTLSTTSPAQFSVCKRQLAELHKCARQKIISYFYFTCL